MRYRGQTTTFQVRVEIMEQAATGLDDTQIATALVALCGRYGSGDDVPFNKDESASSRIWGGLLPVQSVPFQPL